MKKSILIALVLLLLTGCQTAPTDSNQSLSSTPSSSGIVAPPSYSTRPPASTPATSVPATSTPETGAPEPANTGYAHIYEGNNPFLSVNPDFSGCTVGYLYWIDIATSEVTPIVEEMVLSKVQEGAYVYYVKEVEPTKIYRALIREFSQHELIHETTHGKVGDMTIYPGIENYLQFVADNKKFVVFELDTRVETVLMEQYYIYSGYIQKDEDDTLSNWIIFDGKPTEDSPRADYAYDRSTGESVIEDFGDCDCDECI